MAPRATHVLIPASPPSYPGGYGTIEVHPVRVREVHHHHHPLRRRGCSPCFRAFLLCLLLVLFSLLFSAVCFVAWNFYNLSECEKERLPWEKECKDWLGKDGVGWR